MFQPNTNDFCTPSCQDPHWPAGPLRGKQIILMMHNHHMMEKDHKMIWWKVITRRCTTVRNSDDQAIPLRWAWHQFAFYQQQQHQRISASVTDFRKDICPPQYKLQTPPDMVQTPPHMHHVWFVWSKTSYSGDKRKCHQCGRMNDKKI